MRKFIEKVKTSDAYTLLVIDWAMVGTSVITVVATGDFYLRDIIIGLLLFGIIVRDRKSYRNENIVK